MNSVTARDLTWSAKAFVDLVWPAVREALGNGELVPAEAVMNDRMSRDFDMLASIDGWQVCRPGGIRGIASRVQKLAAAARPYNTFTIRYARTTGAETEFSKRLKAIEQQEGWIYPHFTVQAYVTETLDSLTSCAVVRTRDLFEYAKVNIAANGGRGDRHSAYMQVNSYDGNQFIVVPWDSLTRDGVWILTPPCQSGRARVTLVAAALW